MGWLVGWSRRESLSSDPFHVDVVGRTRLCFTARRHACRSCAAAEGRCRSSRSLLTHSFQVFLGRPRLAPPGTCMPTTELIQPVARSTWPNHCRRLLRRTASTSLMSSLWSSSSDDTSSRSLMPQIQRIIARSLRRSRCRSGALGPHVSQPWSIADLTQAW